MAGSKVALERNVRAYDEVLGGLAVKAGQTVAGVQAEEGKELGSGAGVDYEVLEKYTGKDLEYKEYEPLYACAAEVAEKQHKKGHFVTCDTYVTMSDGTGIVHIAPAFGEDDAKVGRKYDLPFVQFVDGKGELTEETPYAGLFVKKADPEVLKDLDKEGKLFDAPKFEHDYPFCWRPVKNWNWKNGWDCIRNLPIPIRIGGYSVITVICSMK